MTQTNILLFYVTDPQASRRFYADLMGREPVEASPTFVLFMLESGLALGLWGSAGVQPAPVATGGGSELGFRVNSVAEVEETHAQWQARGATIALPPTDLDLGRSLVALDPD